MANTKIREPELPIADLQEDADSPLRLIRCSRRVMENDYGAVVAHCGTNRPIPLPAQQTIFNEILPELWDEIVAHNE